MIPRALVTILTTHEKHLGALKISIDGSEMRGAGIFLKVPVILMRSLG